MVYAQTGSQSGRSESKGCCQRATKPSGAWGDEYGVVSRIVPRRVLGEVGRLC
ncbi:MAG: hypothetical protein SOR95_10340 [Sutterella sp.]|nr:hypothetical protein [Sutterella sp.]